MGQKGFSLVELLTVVATMIILLSVATLQFSSMMRKRDMEKEIRMIYTDLSEVRQKALYEKTPRAVKFTANEFTVYPGPSTTVSPVLRRTLNHPVGWSTADSVLVVTFDTFGISDNDGTLCICIDPSSSNSAQVDSLKITPTRVDLGKRTEGTCVDENINLK